MTVTLKDILREPRELRPGEDLSYALAINNAEKRRDARIASEAMSGMASWLQKHQGKSISVSRRQCTMAWRVWQVTGGEPYKLFEGDWAVECTYGRYIATRAAVMALVNWVLATSKHAKDIEWARRNLKHIMNAHARLPSWRRPSSNIVPKGNKNYDVWVADKEFIGRLLEAIDRVVLESPVPVPWYRDILRIMVLAGLTVAETVNLRKDAIDIALGWQKNDRAWVYVSKRKKVARSFPVILARKEIENLSKWPWPWERVHDLIIPKPDAEVSSRLATYRVIRLRKRLAEEAGVNMNWARVLTGIRIYLAGEIYRATRDWALVSKYSGFALNLCKRFPYLRKIQAMELTGETEDGESVEG